VSRAWFSVAGFCRALSSQFRFERVDLSTLLPWLGFELIPFAKLLCERLQV
jgi:hypothetical protein